MSTPRANTTPDHEAAAASALMEQINDDDAAPTTTGGEGRVAHDRPLGNDLVADKTVLLPDDDVSDDNVDESTSARQQRMAGAVNFFDEILDRNRQRTSEADHLEGRPAGEAGDEDRCPRSRSTSPPPKAATQVDDEDVMEAHRRFGMPSVRYLNAYRHHHHAAAGGGGGPSAAAPLRPSSEPFGNAMSDDSTTDDDKYDENGLLKPLPIGGPVFSILVLCALVLFASGASLTWISRRLPSITHIVTLWKVTTKSQEGIPVDTNVIDIECMELKVRMRLMEIFAILTIGATAMAAPIGAASQLQRKPLLPGVVAAVVGACFSFVTWMMAVAFYYKVNMCPGGRSFAEDKYDFDAGFGLYVAGNVLLVLAVLVAVLKPVVPPSIRRTAVIRMMVLISAVLQILCCVLVTIGTSPIQWFYKWDADGLAEHRITLWTNKTYYKGDRVENAPMADVQCGEMSNFVRFGQAFSCMSIAATFFGSVVTVLASDVLTPKGFGSRLFGLRACVLAMMASLLTSLCPFAAGLSIYFRQFCSPVSLQTDQYHMTGGIVLFGCAMALSAFGLLVLVIVSVVQLVANPSSASVAFGNTRGSAFLFLILIGACILFQAMAADLPLFGKETDDYNWVRWTFWRTYVKQSAVSYTVEFSCNEEGKRLIGAGALNIIALVTLAVAFLLGIGQLTSAFLRKPASVVGLGGCVLLMVSWSLVVSVYREGGFCGKASFEERQFRMREGFVLMMVGWGISVLGCVVNYIVPSRQLRV